MSDTKRIAVLVSGGGTNLQALIDAEGRGELGAGKISLVIASKPGVYALERAKNAGIDAIVLSRKDYASIKDYSRALADKMVAEGIDLVVLAGFLTIIDEQVYEAFPNRILNVHPALIPSFSGKGFYGLHVHEAALKKGVKVSGATVHIVTDGDMGAVKKAVREEFAEHGISHTTVECERTDEVCPEMNCDFHNHTQSHHHHH